eukprot:485811_1
MAVREALQNINLNTYTDIIQSTRVQSQTHLSHILFTEDEHPNMKIPVTLEVSKFEEKCVEFIKGKYFRKKQMEMLLESYSEQTKALFPPKKKQQKKKKQKKKSDKRTMSSEDETASSDDNEDETTNNNNNESIAIDSDNNGMETTNNNNNEANVVL